MNNQLIINKSTEPSQKAFAENHLVQTEGSLNPQLMHTHFHEDGQQFASAQQVDRIYDESAKDALSDAHQLEN